MAMIDLDRLPFNRRMRVLRALGNVTQQELSEAVGVALPRLSEIERGTRMARPEVADAIERALAEAAR
jgi:transcriptional regulator with XRE-family HTH domain